MKTIYYIEQKDYVGGGDLECYRLSDLPSLKELFDNNFSGIRVLYDNEDTKDKYNMELKFSDEVVHNRFGDNDVVVNSIRTEKGFTKICESSYNDIKTIPYVNIYTKPNIVIIKPSNNVTSFNVLIKGKKIFEITDQTRNGNEFINPILIDIDNKNIYLYSEKGMHDTKYKAHRFYKVKVIDIELTQ